MSVPVQENTEVKDKDLSVIRRSLEAGGKLIHQVINGVKHGTTEVRQLILYQSDVILECRVCRNLFRSLPNYLDHKRIYCQEIFPNASLPLLAYSLTKEIPIVYPEPPDDAREFVEMSTLMSKYNQIHKLSSSTISAKDQTQTKSLKSFKFDFQGEPNHPHIIKDSFRDELLPKEVSQFRLEPFAETSVAVKVVPLLHDEETTHDLDKIDDLPKKSTSNVRQQSSDLKSYCSKLPTENSRLVHKLANFRKLQCLKCYQTFSGKQRLIFHIQKVHSESKKIYPCLFCKLKFPSFAAALRHTKNRHNCRENDVSEKLKANSVEVKKTKKPDDLTNSNEPSQHPLKDIRIGLKDNKTTDIVSKSLSYPIRHSKLIHKLADFRKSRCLKCNRTYSGRRGLIFHICRMHSGNRKIYPCLFCKVKFPSFAAALRHIKSHHDCSKESEMKSLIKQLKASGHTEELSCALEPKVKIKKCDSVIQQSKGPSLIGSEIYSCQIKENSYKLEDSPEISKMTNSKFICLLCKQTFAGNRGLRNHIAKKHKDNKNIYPCRYCNMVFFTYISAVEHDHQKHGCEDLDSSNLREEIAANSNNYSISEEKDDTEDEYLNSNKDSEGKLPCNNKKYNIPAKHSKMIHKLASFKASLCLKCHKTFSGSHGLIIHIIRMHCKDRKTYPCLFCKLKFLSVASVVRHAKRRHNRKDAAINDINVKLKDNQQIDNEYIKPSKYKSLKSRTPLFGDKQSTSKGTGFKVSHKNITRSYNIPIEHSSIVNNFANFKKLLCLKCSQTFSGVRGLVCHIVRAHGENATYPCSHCNIKFPSIAASERHMKNYHNLSRKEIKQIFTQQKTNELLEKKPISQLEQKSNSEKASSQSHIVQPTSENALWCDSSQTASCSQLVFDYANFKKSLCLKRNQNFSGTPGLISHIYKAHGKSKKVYSCPVCIMKFFSFADASRHAKNQHNYKGKDKKFVQISLETNKKLDVANANKTKGRPSLKAQDMLEKTDCSLETELFKPIKMSLNNHVRNSPLVLKLANFEKSLCLKCNQTFSGKHGLVLHISRMHGEERKIFSCLFCKLDFPSFVSVLNHVKHQHNCDNVKDIATKLKANFRIVKRANKICAPRFKKRVIAFKNRKFCNKLRKRAVQEINSSSLRTQNPLTCQVCLKVFGNQRILLAHSKYCSKQETKKIATKIKGTQSEMDNPKENSHKEKTINKNSENMNKIIDEKKLKCLKCQKIYSSLLFLRMHAAKHLGISHYICKLCQFSSFDKNSCCHHVKINHSEEIPFVSKDAFLYISRHWTEDQHSYGQLKC